MKMGFGDNDCSARRTLWTALVLVLAVCVCLLSGLWDETQARVADQGSWCWRIGPHPSGLAMWSDDGGDSWHE